MRTASLALFLATTPLVACHVDFGRHTSFADSRAKAQRTETLPLAVPSAHLDVAIERGDVHLRAASGATPEVHATFRAGADTQATADAVLTKLVLGIADKDGATRVRLEGAPDDGSNVYAGVDLEITVPDGFAVELSSASGRVVVDGAGTRAAKLHSSFGDVTATGIAGPLDASSDSGDVTVHDVQSASLDARTSFGAVVVENAKVEGALKAASSSGNVTARDCEAPSIALKTSFGDVQAQRARGEIDLVTSSGKVDAQECTGRITARSSFGTVQIVGVSTQIDAHSSSGAVVVDARPGSRIDGEWKVGSSFGDVTVKLPSDAAFDLDAKTSFGSVTVGFPVELPANSQSQASAVRGKIHGGGGKLEVKTSSGSVKVVPGA